MARHASADKAAQKAQRAAEQAAEKAARLAARRAAQQEAKVRRATAPAHARTPRGLSGLGGGRWGQVPQPPDWYGSSAQLCGIYPFAAGTFRPTQGTPLGRDMEVGTAVAGDMATWYPSLISSQTMMMFGLNGNGKSSAAQRLAIGQAARGMVPAFWDPIKGEHAALTRRLGGQHVKIGLGSIYGINPLDLGALGDAARRIGGVRGAELREQALGQAVDVVTLVVQVNRGAPLRDIEETALQLLTISIIERIDRPTIHDLARAFEQPPPEVITGTGCYDAAEFQADFKQLRQSVLSVVHGKVGQLLGGQQSVRLEVGNPGGFCFDTSSIPESNGRLLSAAMLATWQIGFSTIDAHWELAQYDPEVPWYGYTATQDEFWFPMRHCEGIVDRADRIGRTQRGLGVSENKITHSPKDFLSLPNEHDRATARGFAQRAGVLGLMALSLDDLYELSEKVVPLNPREIARVSSFNAPPGWKPARDTSGRPLPPPGAGKILFKIPGRVGMPVQMSLTEIERDEHDTDDRSRNVGVLAARRVLDEAAAVRLGAMNAVVPDSEGVGA